MQLFREKLSYNQGKAYATMPNASMGNGGFYGCLSEPCGVSAWWKARVEGNSTNTCIHTFSFLVAKSH